MRERVLALNSGGFDSVALIHYLYHNENMDVESLFIDFNQNGKEYEREKARKVAEKLNLWHREIELPMMSIQEGEVEYVPGRNGILIAHAIHVALASGITKVAAAILAPDNRGIVDTEDEFKDCMIEYAKIYGVELLLPFRDMEKIELTPIAREYMIMPDDYFTCNFSVKGVPCGECGGCRITALIDEKVKDTKPSHVWYRNRLQSSYHFNEMVYSHVPEVLIVEGADTEIPLEERVSRLKKYISDIGMKEIMFTGKEIQYDLAREIKRIAPDIKLSLKIKQDTIPPTDEEMKYVDLIISEQEISTERPFRALRRLIPDNDKVIEEIKRLRAEGVKEIEIYMEEDTDSSLYKLNNLCERLAPLETGDIHIEIRITPNLTRELMEHEEKYRLGAVLIDATFSLNFWVTPDVLLIPYYYDEESIRWVKTNADLEMSGEETDFSNLEKELSNRRADTLGRIHLNERKHGKYYIANENFSDYSI